MRATMLMMVVCLAWGATKGTANARTIQQTYVVESGNKGMLRLSRQALGSESTIALTGNENIVFAELQFDDPLPNGTEIEVWPAVQGRTITGGNNLQ